MTDRRRRIGVPRSSPAHPQNRLAARAQAGDREAAEELARQVMPWANRKASEYAERFGFDTDELLSVALLKFPAAVRTYKPEQGGFLNYFAGAAARYMIDFCTLQRGTRETANYDDYHEASGRDHDWPDDLPAAVMAKVDALPPLARGLVVRVHGLGGSPPVPLEDAGRELGLLPARYEALYAQAFNTLSDSLRRVNPN